MTYPKPEFLPRIVRVGPLRLDLFHRDALIAGKWVRLFPREFEVLWRLAQSPGKTLSRRQLLSDVWRIDCESESNRVEVSISRIRSKLHHFRLSWLIETDPAGGYRLVQDSLDSISGLGNDGGADE